MRETWKTIPGYPKLYMVSDRGRIFSVRYGRYLKPNRSGFVTLQFRREKVTKRVSELVNSAFPCACNIGECTSSVDCWKCGLNPGVAAERKELLAKRGLQKNGNGTWGLKLTAADYRKGETKYTPREI